MIKEITKQELEDKYADFLTVGRLKKFIEEHNLTDDAKVLIQRVEDVYLKEEGEHLPGVFSQYRPAWSAVKYKDEQNILFIDLHS